MNILILGSQGFIGSHLVTYFLNKEYIVYGCDLVEYSTDKYNYQKISILSSDFETLFINQRFDVCIYAAGSGNVAYSVLHPNSDFEANTLAVVKVLDTLRKFQPLCKYLQISSAAVYGNPNQLPVKETARIAPLSPYGYHKWMCEILCKEYHELYNINIAIIRPFSVYGNGLRKQLFWDICEKLSHMDHIHLFGSGNESRDFLHIEDLCKLINAVIDQSAFEGDIYNAATGTETTIREIADIFQSTFPGNKKISFSSEVKPGDPINWNADVSKIKNIGFEPVISLATGIPDYIHWYSKNMHAE